MAEEDRIRIAIQHEDFDIGVLIGEAREQSSGAIVTFVGIVRDDGIETLELEAYEEVAVRELRKIVEKAVSQHNLHSVTVVHRVGPLKVGENIVAIVVSAGHRREAFLGCEVIIDWLKTEVPIWKKEHRNDGATWVKGESPEAEHL
ncbi:molybdenum cofactor biosynthesis protein MoaE [Methanosphaerula palustris]|uniref:Molybdopterin biosynthesis MoaE protein n=1 Tax=Methanosphaerula palustris (strain ATCC BAA-1556 / DSM 19958 / E1-9c) TaxID=521011 RepID=B8GHP4_METPE|nr:molybdenum cofactor biosynthesis protein MoaE [Methanosphaerula palustris]ACL16649.1 molybdopterin biosynthesis MoaE protein [Methanosphaerula palustris E1-9c]